MEKLICLTDYKNHFGLKWKDSPYRSGMDKNYLAELFKKAKYDIEFIEMGQVDFFRGAWRNRIVIYTSSEEFGLYYKSFIEDVVYGLKEAGAKVIPDISFLRANNNKVFMEILRKILLPENLQSIDSLVFGTYDELRKALQADKIPLPCVIKKSAGAMSRGVFLARNENELIGITRTISHTAPLKVSLKEKGRSYKHKGYKPESNYQAKFIIQPFISGLKNDWKVLIFGDKFFVFERPTRKNDFRASGSGSDKYIYGSDVDFPAGLFDFAGQIFERLNVPHASLDIAYDGKDFYLFEFQIIYFGTVGVFKSNCYYSIKEGSWELMANEMTLEEVYVQSIVEYLKRGKC